MFNKKITGQEIARLTERLSELHGQVAGAAKELHLSQDLVDLQKEKVALEIQLDKMREDHARENREIEHKIGLHKKQVQHEIAAAQKETELKVREENLTAERERFGKEMEFMQGRFEDEVKAQRTLLDQVLSRLPTVNVERSFKTVEHVGVVPEALEAGDRE